jgi:hypothetical protein
MDAKDAIFVCTYQTIEQIRDAGGCGNWPLGKNPRQAYEMGARYVVCIRNRNGRPQPPSVSDRIEHGRPFMIGRLLPMAKVIREEVTKNGLQRQLLLISEFAELPEGTPKQRVTQNVKYACVADLGINIDKLTFKSFARDLRTRM